ncbi:hypothetical protein FG93_05175 [Bosea sp. LC85]|nr:hypothetical protein FG93_05175 [Bosea sp. LC85]
MTGQCAATSVAGTVPARKGRADATTTRLIALLRMTASSAPNRNAPISKGRRNSAPPSPISPPNVPMRAPPANAPERERGVVAVTDASVMGACQDRYGATNIALRDAAPSLSISVSAHRPIPDIAVDAHRVRKGRVSPLAAFPGQGLAAPEPGARLQQWRCLCLARAQDGPPALADGRPEIGDALLGVGPGRCGAGFSLGQNAPG